MNWVIRIIKALLFTAGGTACGALVGWLFITIWTAIFSGVPLNQAWRYIQDDSGRRMFAFGVIILAAVVGLGAGLVKGIRSR